MKLADSREDIVVRNRNNKSFYRFVRPEAERIRIRPLELFPNGLLIEKSADTIVAGDLQVDVIGEWQEWFFVNEPAAGRLRSKYEIELTVQQEKLIVLMEELETLDPKRRGSHANKVKAVERRVKSIQNGLGSRSPDVQIFETLFAGPGGRKKITKVLFSPKDLIALPSGITGMVTRCRGNKATIACEIHGEIQHIPVPASILSPLRALHSSTI